MAPEDAVATTPASRATLVVPTALTCTVTVLVEDWPLAVTVSVNT